MDGSDMNPEFTNGGGAYSRARRNPLEPQGRTFLAGKIRERGGGGGRKEELRNISTEELLKTLVRPITDVEIRQLREEKTRRWNQISSRVDLEGVKVAIDSVMEAVNQGKRPEEGRDIADLSADLAKTSGLDENQSEILVAVMRDEVRARSLQNGKVPNDEIDRLRDQDMRQRVTDLSGIPVKEYKSSGSGGRGVLIEPKAELGEGLKSEPMTPEQLKQAFAEALKEDREARDAGTGKDKGALEKVLETAAKLGWPVAALYGVADEFGFSETEKAALATLIEVERKVANEVKKKVQQDPGGAKGGEGDIQESRKTEGLEDFRNEIKKLNPRLLQIKLLGETDLEKLKLIQEEKKERLSELVVEYEQRTGGGDLVAYRRQRLEDVLLRSFPTNFRAPLLDYRNNFGHQDILNDDRHRGLVGIWVEDEVRNVLLQIYDGIRDPAVISSHVPSSTEILKERQINDKSRIQMGVDVLNPVGILERVPATREGWETMMQSWPFSPEVRRSMEAYYDEKEQREKKEDTGRTESGGWIPAKPESDAELEGGHDERFYTMNTLKKWKLPEVVWTYELSEGKWVPMDVLKALNNLAIEGKTDLWDAFKRTQEWKKIEQERPDFAFNLKFGFEGFALLCNYPPLAGGDLVGGEGSAGILNANNVKETFMATFVSLNENQEAKRALAIMQAMKNRQIGSLSEADRAFVGGLLMTKHRVQEGAGYVEKTIGEIMNKSQAVNTQQMRQQWAELDPVIRMVANRTGVDFGMAKTMFVFEEVSSGGSAWNMQGARLRKFNQREIRPDFNMIVGGAYLSERQKRIIEKYKEGEWLNGFYGLIDDQGNSLTEEDLQGTGLFQNGIVDANGVTLAEHLAKGGIDGWLKAVSGLGAGKMKQSWEKQTVLTGTLKKTKDKAERKDAAYWRKSTTDISAEIRADLAALGKSSPETILSKQKIDLLARMRIADPKRSEALPGLLGRLPEVITNPEDPVRRGLLDLYYIKYPMKGFLGFWKWALGVDRRAKKTGTAREEDENES